MVETTKKFIEETKGTMRDFIKYMVDDGAFECSIDANGLNMLIKMKKLFDTSMEIMLEQAELLEDQNKKLDKVLALMEKKGS